MKSIFALAFLACLGTVVNAQNNPAAAPAAQPAVAAPAAPATVAAPAVVAAAPAMTMEELRKKHIDAVATLKKSNIDEIKNLRESMKGKSSRADIMKAVEAKKAQQKAIIKDLEKANKAEIEQFKKDHPKMAKKLAKPEMPKK